ncbi:MAG: hypothetical protein ACXVNM_12330 [Bacteroidia bacterium]
MDYDLRYNQHAKETLIIGYRRALNNWLRQFATIVNLQKKSFKIQESLLGIFKWGTFKPLQKINYVLVFKSSFVKCESCSIEEHKENPYSYFQVSLVYNNNRRIIVHETKTKISAFELAHNLASGLNTRLKDSASDARKSTWLI